MKINKTTFNTVGYLYYKYLIRNKILLYILAAFFILVLLNFTLATVYTPDDPPTLKPLDWDGSGGGGGIYISGYIPSTYLETALQTSIIIIPSFFILITLGVVFNNIFSGHFLKQIKLSNNSFLDYVITFFIIELVITISIFTLSLFSLLSIYSVRLSDYWEYAFNFIGIVKIYLYFILYASFFISIGMYICTLKIDKIIRIILLVFYFVLIFWIDIYDQGYNLWMGVSEDPNYINNDWTRIITQGWFIILLWIFNPLAFLQGSFTVIFSSELYHYYANDIYFGQLSDAFIVMMTLNIALLISGSICFMPLTSRNLKRSNW